jgi:hypothetical protein
LASQLQALIAVLPAGALEPGVQGVHVPLLSLAPLEAYELTGQMQALAWVCPDKPAVVRPLAQGVHASFKTFFPYVLAAQLQESKVVAVEPV